MAAESLCPDDCEEDHDHWFASKIHVADLHKVDEQWSEDGTVTVTYQLEVTKGEVDARTNH